MGELTCRFFNCHDTAKPSECKPTLATCNKRCPVYQECDEAIGESLAAKIRDTFLGEHYYGMRRQNERRHD